MNQLPHKTTDDRDNTKHAPSQSGNTPANTNVQTTTNPSTTASPTSNQHIKTGQAPDGSRQRCPKNTSAVKRSPPDKNDSDLDSGDDIVVFDAERARRLRGQAAIIPAAIEEQSSVTKDDTEGAKLASGTKGGGQNGSR
ncbi:hypothetical protein PMZ80_010172 [Knufia obscura]|uniref:Uncharacterized protein n=2 Tax=Knufia TaxID=430999 RepID=A0AAN8IM79_9EURO|nr:hypothetical protein PMZ80_010172 [Knufia obscura]KAK5952912.1 hypothetical protein OHC33_006033 [Knufia fluminis]